MPPKLSKKRTGCSVPDCDCPHWAQGLCALHYNRWYRGEHLPAVRSRQQATPLSLPTSEVDLGYLTALLDREGTITQTTYGDYWRVSVNNTEKEIIDWLATIGGTTSSQSQGTKRKVMLIWTLANQKYVHDLLSAVLPYLKTSEKQDKAQKAITEISTRDASPLRSGHGRTRKRPEENLR